MAEECPHCVRLREELATVKATLRTNLDMLDEAREQLKDAKREVDELERENFELEELMG